MVEIFQPAGTPGGAGTVTSVAGTTNRITVANPTTTPVVDISSSYVGQASITTVGTLSSGAVPASLVTAGTFGAGAYTFPSTLTIATSETVPLIIGGSSTTSSLTIQSTSNAGHTTGADIIFKSGSVENARFYDNGKVVFGATATTKNAVLYDPNATNSIGDVTGLLGMYDPGNALYYGISRSLPSPTGTATAGGYYQGLGIGGATSGAGNPIFGVLNRTESGNGIGSVSLTIYDNTKIVTRHSTLDDGNGRMGVNLATVTAFLHLPAGSAGASNAPLKLTAGTNTGTTGETGAVEYDGTNLFFTPTGTVRKTIPTTVMGRSAAQTAAVTSVVAETVGGADASYEISGNINVTTATLHTFTMTCVYTDETNTSRTLTLPFQLLAGTSVTSITNAQGAVPYEGTPVHIRAKAGTTITLATTGTFTTVTYNVEGRITLLK